MGLWAVAYRAGIAVLDYEYAARRQMLAMVGRRPVPEPTGSPSRLPVLVLPGVYERWRFLLPLVRHLAARGHRIEVVEALDRNILPVEQAARLVAAQLESLDAERIAIVAHSKGGLIAKRVAELCGPRIAVVVAVATPFAGSSLARFVPMRELRALGPAGTDVQELHGRTAANGRIVSIRPSFDTHIPRGEALVGARDVVLRTGGHFRILSSRALFAAVDDAFDAAEATP